MDSRRYSQGASKQGVEHPDTLARFDAYHRDRDYSDDGPRAYVGFYFSTMRGHRLESYQL